MYTTWYLFSFACSRTQFHNNWVWIFRINSGRNSPNNTNEESLLTSRFLYYYVQTTTIFYIISNAIIIW